MILLEFAPVPISDCISNVNAVVGNIIALVALIIGTKKVFDIHSDFQKRKNDAVFGYYRNIEVLIMRLKHLITNDHGRPLGTIYQLSNVDAVRDSDRGRTGISLTSNLKMLSFEFIRYLSSANSQMPPVSNMEEQKKWEKNFTLLIDFLNRLSTIKTVYFSGLSSDKEVADYHEKIITMLNFIEEKINEKTKGLLEEFLNTKKK